MRLRGCLPLRDCLRRLHFDSKRRSLFERQAAASRLQLLRNGTNTLAKKTIFGSPQPPTKRGVRVSGVVPGVKRRFETVPQMSPHNENRLDELRNFVGSGGGSQRPSTSTSTVACAGLRHSLWVDKLCKPASSDAHGSPGKADSPFRRPPPNLLLEDSVAGGATPPWAPRRGRWSPGIHSGLVRGVFVRLRVRSCAVPKGIHEGWYPANIERHL